MMKPFRLYLACGLALSLVLYVAYLRAHSSPHTPPQAPPAEPVVQEIGGYRKIHVYVALCDNKNQGIVPVPPAIGNGQDPARNLYWGARYGVKTFFTKSREWKLVQDIGRPKAHVLERLIFKHTSKKVYLIADAYDGACMREAITDLLTSSAGMKPEKVTIGKHPFLFAGGADVIAFVGHDGLMDFTLDLQLTPHAKKPKEVLLFCCTSSTFFRPWMQQAGAHPLIWTTNLMCPEAYTLKVALDGWISGDSPQRIHEKVAKTYSQYQRCSVKAARGLFKTGY
ncbi:MAG: hypothetical protein ACYDBB_18590 [Armatimonadota bacterium]